MWKLRIEDDQSNRTVVSLVRQEYTIGRAEENSVRLTERNVSRRHAKLLRAGEAWLLEDLGSTTGTYVDEQRVIGQVSLSHGTGIRIGDYNILLFDDTLPLGQPLDRGALTIPAPLTSESAHLPGDRLIVVEGPNVGASYPLGERRLLIGRGEECDISLNDTSVSRVHADIERDESGRYRISDQKSSNGVRVNGMEISSTTLYSGDIVELGDVQLQYVPRGQVFSLSDHPRAHGRRNGIWAQLTRTQRWATLGVGVAALGSAVAWGLTSSAPPTREAKGTEAARALDLGRRHLERGDLNAAHAALDSIQPDSTLRSSASFQRIEAAWADDLLERADRAADDRLRRQLLERVLESTTVDETRRQQARDRLGELEALKQAASAALQAVPSDGGATLNDEPEPVPTLEPLATKAARPPSAQALPRRSAPRPAPAVLPPPAPSPDPEEPPASPQSEPAQAPPTPLLEPGLAPRPNPSPEGAPPGPALAPGPAPIPPP